MLNLFLSEKQETNYYFPIPMYIFIALSFLLLLLKWPSSFSSKKLNLPPSPRTFPIVGNLHQLGLHPHHSLRAMAQTHGPIMLLQLGRVPVLVISSAEMAREIMKTHDNIFSDRPKYKVNKILVYDQRDIAVAPYGECWRQMKTMAVLHLLSNKRVQSYRNVREHETNLMVEEIKNSSSSTVNLTKIFVTLTNDVVCRVALGRKYNGTAGRNFMDILKEASAIFGAFDVGDFIPWLAWVSSAKGLYSKTKKLAKEFDEFLDRVLDEHAVEDNEHRNKDFVDVLLWIQKENKSGFPIDRTSIKAIILDVFAAGTDSTYTVLEWVMTELLRHPNVMKKLQSEIRETMKNKPEITEGDVNKFPYLKAVMKEILRVHPPIPLLIPRVAMQDVKVKGFDIAAGTQVFINDFAIGRDPEIWDRAEEFYPERFLNSSIDFKGQNFELIPFGSGRRICPGIQFAMSINELALAKLMHSFDWRLQGGDLDMNETTGGTVHRQIPLLAVATPYSCSY